MQTRILLLLASAIWLVWPNSPVAARALPSWPYEKLFKEADLVVVVVAKATEDTDDKPTHPDMKQDFVGLESIFEVRGCMKGKADGEEIKVLHFRLKEGFAIKNGPCLVNFSAKAREVTNEKGGTRIQARPEYLLFLKARKDGRFEPLSGQYDPALSVREMYRPSLK